MGQRQGLNGTRFFSETAALYLFKDTLVKRKFPDRDSITKRPVPTQPTPTDGVVPLSEIGKLFISLMSFTFFVLQLNN
jgi:hypothetical protein